MTNENFVEIEDKRRKLSIAKCNETFGNRYSDAYQSLSSIHCIVLHCIIRTV